MAAGRQHVVVVFAVVCLFFTPSLSFGQGAGYSLVAPASAATITGIARNIPFTLHPLSANVNVDVSCVNVTNMPGANCSIAGGTNPISLAGGDVSLDAVLTIPAGPNPCGNSAGCSLTIHTVDAGAPATPAQDAVVMIFPPVTASTDFDGDGHADILWQNSPIGGAALWRMNGAARQSATSVAAAVDPSWKIVGVGDFNGDGMADILWQNSVSGGVVLWLMNGPVKQSAAFVATGVDASWQIVGVGDFNGDGMADILWRNSSSGSVVVWLMNGAAKQSAAFVATGVDPSWQIVSVGDFNRDGMADILWQHSSTGGVALWFMNGATRISASFLAPAVDPSWKIVGVGDFNGDGQADILWQNQVTGQVGIWFLNGTQETGAAVATVSDLNWQIFGVGDFNGDGNSDLVWQNRSTGQVQVWLMNGAQILSSTPAPTVSDALWQIAAPGGNPGGSAAGSTLVTVTFAQTPSAVALQIDSGPFVPASLQGNQYSFTLPSATSKYALAWACGQAPGGGQNVIEATLQDATAYTAYCNGPWVTQSTPLSDAPQGTATGSVDASAIPGAGGAVIWANSGLPAATYPQNSGSFTLTTSAGANDIAVLAEDSSGGKTLAVRILRDQTVPGAVNGGNTITLDSGDLLGAPQPLNVLNLPQGFEPVGVTTYYNMARGGSALLAQAVVAPEYPVLPAAAAESGDSYFLIVGSGNVPAGDSTINTYMNAPGGGPLTVALPDPWLYSGPDPVPFPTFTIDYSGFAALPTVTQEAEIQWLVNLGGEPPRTRESFMTVMATASYQEGATTLSLPDLTSLPGFVAPPPSGTFVIWFSLIRGGTGPEVGLLPLIAPNNPAFEVNNKGTYIEP